MVVALDRGSSGLGSSPGCGHSWAMHFTLTPGPGAVGGWGVEGWASILFS